MKRAVAFYKKLFMVEPEHVNKRFSNFKLNGFSFGLYCPKVDKYKVTYGDNCVPNLEVNSIESEYKRIRKFSKEIDGKIQIIGDVSTFQFVDSEGNVVEIYSRKLKFNG
jgi:predicted enzyme related to lactoylglutathione lyase